MTGDSGRRPRIAGAAEIAAMLSVTRQRVDQIAAADPEFPAPLAELAAGRIWLLDEVEEWAKSAGRI